MTLLQEIQNSAIDGSSDLPSLLRKCRILAERLKNQEFKAWVQNELDGYPKSSALPNYRVERAQSFGDFYGPGGMSFQNAPIPLSCLPDKLRDGASKVEFREGISGLQSLVGDKKGLAKLRQNWPADLVAMHADKVYESMTMGNAWKVISPVTIISILDTVRNRILNFVLEIEAQSPNAGESGTMTPPLTAEKVTNIFNTYITGNVGNLATASTNVTQEATIIAPGDWAGLQKALSALGLPEADIQSLEVAISQDPKPETRHKLGHQVATWVGRMVAKSAQGAWNISTAVAANVLSKVLAQYYGFPP